MKDMEITKDIKCSGCGVLIQTKDKEKEGFVPEHVVLAHDESKPIYCQRCFRIRNYQEYASNDLSGEDYIKVISQINTKDSLIVLIVDIFDFSGSFLPNIKRLTGQNDVILAANKVDLLPSSVNKEKILSWVNELCEDEGLQVLDSILISSKKNIVILSAKPNLFIFWCVNNPKIALQMLIFNAAGLQIRPSVPNIDKIIN